MKVNIPQDVIDQFYRYKRDTISTTFVSKQGGQTQIDNLETVCQQIGRPMKEIKKYLQKKLNLCIKDSKTGSRLPGNIGWCMIDDALENYIIEHILCKTCGNPETDLKGRCKACGN